VTSQSNKVIPQPVAKAVVPATMPEKRTSCRSSDYFRNGKATAVMEADA
jgi:hypothetical protein